jgi:hypothetical protein
LRLARSSRDESAVIVHEVFANSIRTHTSQLYSCSETHEVALGLKVCRGERERDREREREREGEEGGRAPERDNGACSLHKEQAGHLATYASPIKSKGGSDEEPAGAPGLRFLPLAFSSWGMGPRR